MTLPNTKSARNYVFNVFIVIVLFYYDVVRLYSTSKMPTFMDSHPMGKYTEDDLKKSQKELRDEFGVRVLNILYDMGTGMIFCLIDAPDRLAVERHHSKFGVK